MQSTSLRLVCREFNKIVTPFLCPVVAVDLSCASISRLEGLLANDLIARGVHGIAISLRFRPDSIATDFRKFHAHANTVLDEFIRSCNWHTEFQSFDENDMCEAAIIFRSCWTTYHKLEQMRVAWQSLINQQGSNQIQERRRMAAQISRIGKRSMRFWSMPTRVEQSWRQ